MNETLACMNCLSVMLTAGIGTIGLGITLLSHYISKLTRTKR